MSEKVTRIVGYDNADSFRAFLIETYAEAKKTGLFFKEKLPLASTDEISAAQSYAAADLTDAKSLKSGLDAWLRTINAPCDSAAVADIMVRAVNECGANKKNTYFILLCWFIKYFAPRPRMLMYVGGATLRELYFFRMMAAAGVKVTLVTYGLDNEFPRLACGGMVDIQTGRLSSPIQIDYDHIDLSREAMLSQMRAAGKQVSGLVTRLDTTAAAMFEDVLKSRKERVIKGGGVYTEDGEIPVYFAALIGCSEEAVYTNMLVSFKESFAGLKKQLIFIEKPLSNPDADEVRAIGTVPKTSTSQMIDGLSLQIKLNGDNIRTALAQNALRETLEAVNTGNQTVVQNYGNKFITWLYRCTQARKYAVRYEDIPVILYYGDISQSELYFLHFMSKCGFDVIYITPNKQMLDLTLDKNTDNRMQIFQLPESRPSGSYPDKPVKMKVATVAYSAERDLDTMLYGGDTGIFRDFQFPISRTVTLKTTYDEIGILWKQEARFRTGFATAGEMVTVPNIFAKISGVQDGNINAYWDDVRKKLTPETILCIQQKGAKPEPAPDLAAYRSFYRNGKIDEQKLKASPLNKYSYLPDRIQDMLFAKLQETVSSGFLKLEGDELVCSVLHYGLNLDRETLKIIQSFDFTKRIPKLIYIDTVEDTFTLSQCVTMVLCSLVGFDVLIYTPTGYKNLETYVDKSAFEEHIRNEFLYNLEVPKLKIPSDDKSSGLFGKLFGGSKKG